MARRPERRREGGATGFFTTIRRGPTRASSPSPTSIEYQGELAQRRRRCCAKPRTLTTKPTLKKFLTARADAFLSNDYYASDVAWMELDAAIEPTIGPYEVYEDEWFNAKAAFEAFITVRDDAESKKLQSFSAHLQELENALPIDPEVPQRQARRAGADPRRQRRVRGRRRQPRRPDRRLQPAQRRARREGEGHQARHAQEHAGREVQRGAACRSPRSRCPPPTAEGRVVRRVLHAHPDARADARARPAQHHGRRPRRRPSARS